MAKKYKLPTMQERYARLFSYGPVAMSVEHLPQVISRIDPRTERAIANAPGFIAIIPMRGVIVPREDRYSQMFGEVGSEDTVRRIQAAVSDKQVKAVVLDVDSPGGSVSGLQEAVAAIQAIDTNKPIIAHADYTMASAAYHIACGCDEIVGCPSAQIGAVGVLSSFFDYTENLAQNGVKATPFAKPDDKADGWGLWPNSDKFEPRMKQAVADAYDVFASTVSAARGVDKAAILADWAGMYAAPRAKALGMIDKIRPMADTLGAYSPSSTGQTSLIASKLRLRRLQARKA